VYREVHGARDADFWRPLYGMRELKSSMRKIQTVSYNETLSVFGLVDVTASR
jgi:hypothetical protein